MRSSFTALSAPLWADNLPYIILFILSGAIAELLLWKMGYGNAKALTVSYVINQVLAAFGSTIIPYAIAAKAMADQMVTDGRQDAILAASQMLQSWVSVALVAGVIVPHSSEQLSARAS